MDDTRDSARPYGDSIQGVDWRLREELVQAVNNIAEMTSRSADSVVDGLLVQAIGSFRSEAVTLRNVRVVDKLT